MTWFTSMEGCKPKIVYTPPLSRIYIYICKIDSDRSLYFQQKADSDRSLNLKNHHTPPTQSNYIPTLLLGCTHNSIREKF